MFEGGALRYNVVQIENQRHELIFFMNWRSEVNVEPVLLNVFIYKFFIPLSLSCKIMQSTLSLKCPSG